MIVYIYQFDGFSFRTIDDDDYVAQPGEVVSEYQMTEEELLIAFPNRAQVLVSNARTDRINSLTFLCRAAIAGGFQSSALGAAHAYPSNTYDQSNLHTAVLAIPGAPTGWTTSYWCSDGTTWAFTAHTAAQTKQVLLDYHASVQGFQEHWADLVALINAAVTVNDVNTITW